MKCTHLGKRVDLEWVLVPLASEESATETERWNLEIQSVRCECGEAFKFFGAPMGYSTARIVTNLFGTKLSVPCIPASQEFPKGRDIDIGVRVHGGDERG